LVFGSPLLLQSAPQAVVSPRCGDASLFRSAERSLSLGFFASLRMTPAVAVTLSAAKGLTSTGPTSLQLGDSAPWAGHSATQATARAGERCLPIQAAWPRAGCQPGPWAQASSAADFGFSIQFASWRCGTGWLRPPAEPEGLPPLWAPPRANRRHRTGHHRPWAAGPPAWACLGRGRA
jgi:hypothetical protein